MTWHVVHLQAATQVQLSFIKKSFKKRKIKKQINIVLSEIMWEHCTVDFLLFGEAGL